MFENLSILAATEQGQWRPGIGDPTPLGWFTVVAYLAAALACGAAAIAERRAVRRGEPAIPGLWLVLAGLMLFLGINKQLDLQTLFGTIGRQIAREQGWYGQRRQVQAAFIAGLGLGGLALLAGLAWWIRRLWRRCLLALAGVVFLFAFVLIRASSFHHVDALLGSTALGIRWNAILELGGIALVGLGALVAHGDRRRASAARAAPARQAADPAGASTYTFVRGVLVLKESPARRPGRRG